MTRLHGATVLAIGAWLGALACGARRSACADDPYEPLVVVSLSSYEKLVRDISSLSDPRLTALAADLLGKQLRMPIDPTTLAPVGLDCRRPWGLVQETDGQTFPIYGFIPVTDLDRVLAGLVASGQIKPPRQGVYQVPFGGRTWFVAQRLAQRQSWAMFASGADTLEKTPLEPASVLGGLDSSCDLAARVFFQKLPKEVRQVAHRWSAEGARVVLDRTLGETDLQYALRNALANQGLQLLASLADEGEAAVVGLTMDLRTRLVIADVEVTAQPGSSIAESLRAPSKSETSFRGFLMPSAVLAGVWTGEVARMPLYQLLNLFDAVVGHLAPASASADISQLWRAVRDALMEESVDGGVVGLVRPNGVTLAAGGYVADGSKLQKLIEKLAEAGRKELATGRAVTWRLDAARYADVRLHSLAFGIPGDIKDRAALERMLGDPLEVVVGVGRSSVYVALGRNPLDTLKNVMRGSRTPLPKTHPPVQFHAALGPCVAVLAEASGAQDRHSQLGRFAAGLSQAPGKDHLRLTGRPVPRGVRFRLEMEEGVVRALLKAGFPL